MRARRVNCIARTLLAGATACAAGSGSASAHPEMSPTLVNRYVTGAVLEQTLEVSFVLLAGAMPGRELRTSLDSDGDGTIAPAELTNARERWQREANDWIAAELDGERLVLRPEALVDLGTSAAIDAAPVVIELRASLPIARARHELRLEARKEPPRVGETELSFLPAPDWRLVGSGEGRDATGRGDARYSWSGSRAGSPAAATFAFEPAPAAAPARDPDKAKAPLAAVVAAMAGLGACIAWITRRKRRR